jgi:WD40 repeat protein
MLPTKAGMIRASIFILMLTFLIWTVSAQVVIDQPLAETPVGATILDVEWHPEGQVLAVASMSGVTIFTDTLQELTQVNQGAGIFSISWSPDGDQLAMTYSDTIEIWNWDSATNTLSLTTTLQGNSIQVTVVWSPDGNRLASIGATGLDSYIGTIHIWDVTQWQLERLITEQYSVNISHITANLLDWDPSGAPLLLGAGWGVQLQNGNVVGTTDFIAYIIDVETDVRVKEIPLVGPYAFSVAWQPSPGNLIAIGSEITVDLYDVSTGEYVRSVGNSADVTALDWSPDGRHISGNGAITDVATFTELGFFAALNPTGATQWHPDGDRLALAGADTVRIEDPSLLPGFNLSPTADVGPDQTVTAPDGISAQVTLDGSGSYDPDGEIVSYVWTIDEVEIATGVNPSVALDVGVHVITLTVTDSEEATDSDQVTITVE